MSFLKKLFGSKEQSGDPDGIYFYVLCENCGEKLRVRADKRHDLVRDYETGQLTWKKGIMDGRCFKTMYATVEFDASFRIQSQDLEGKGRFITKEEYLEGKEA